MPAANAVVRVRGAFPHEGAGHVLSRARHVWVGQEWRALIQHWSGGLELCGSGTPWLSPSCFPGQDPHSRSPRWVRVQVGGHSPGEPIGDLGLTEVLFMPVGHILPMLQNSKVPSGLQKDQDVHPATCTSLCPTHPMPPEVTFSVSEGHASSVCLH